MSFAAFQSRANASVLKHLANAQVLIGGELVAGIFRNPSQVAALGLGAADTRPSVLVDSSVVPSSPVDTFIEINGTPYVIGACEPDSTGMTMLIVERTE